MILPINLRSRIGVHVMGLKDVMKGKFEMLPDGKTKLLEDQVLLVVGREAEIAALRELPELRRLRFSEA